MFAIALSTPSYTIDLNAPSGTYSGSKMGVNAKITVNDGSHASISISGLVKVSCGNEEYKYTGSKIDLPNLSKKGDCVHDALQKNDASISGITYDTGKDEITVGAKAHGVSTKIVLKHGSLTEDPTDFSGIFANWKQIHNKAYPTGAAEVAAFGTFVDNAQIIMRHNALNSTFSMGLNAFSDLSAEQFAERLGYDEAAAAIELKMIDEHEIPAGEVLPDAIDHDEERAKLGCVTPVKNQGPQAALPHHRLLAASPFTPFASGSCGSCWAFSATGALEGQLSPCTSLSEQDLVGCDKSDGGCGGGSMSSAFRWVSQNGIASESAYPYTRSSSCDSSKKNNPVATCSGSRSASGISGLKSAVASHPVSIGVTGSYLQHYQGGIIDDSACSGQLNHGVLAVGYGSSGGDYFRVKNSWGSGWGESGYFRVAAKSGMCGLGKQSVYPTGVRKE